MINSGERGFGLPKFRQAERERRWGRVRELMGEAHLDAIIGFPNQSHWDQFQADVRYLTHIGGHQTEAAMVFPQAGEPTAFVRKASAALICSIPTTIGCKSPPTHRIKKKNCLTTKKNGAASSPAAKNKAAA